MKLVINNNLQLSRMTEQRYLVAFHCTMGSCLHKTLWLAIIVTIELESWKLQYLYLSPLVGSWLQATHVNGLKCWCCTNSHYVSVYEKLLTELSICLTWSLIAFLSLSPVHKWSGQYLAFLQNSEGGAPVGSLPDPGPRMFSSPGLVKASREKSMKKVAEESWVGTWEEQPREAGRK